VQPLTINTSAYACIQKRAACICRDEILDKVSLLVSEIAQVK
jgi:hypothetical protein